MADHILPQEIFDNIIDHFHDDIPSLQACAAVSQAWLSSARAHLFHRVSLLPPKHTRGAGLFFFRTRESRCQELFNLIESSSAKGRRLRPVTQYIRELYLCEGMHAREWLAHEPILPVLLRSLHNLRRLEIGRSASIHISWQQLSQGLKSSIQDEVLHLPSLTELKLGSLMLDNLGDMKKILRSCQHLQVLEVDHIIFANDDVAHLRMEETDEIVRSTRMPLDKLVVGPRTSTAFIACLLHPSSSIDVGTIRKLTMSISGNFADFARLLHASISVEFLELVLMNDVDLQEHWVLPPSLRFDLSQLFRLQTLKVNIDVLQKMEDPLPWLCALLQTGISSSRSNAIRNILIVYAIYLPAPYMDRSVNTTIFEMWRDIDAVLCGTEPGMDFQPGRSALYEHAYEKLERVMLEFVLENPIGFDVAPRFMKEMVLDSPGLEERKILHIGASDTSH
ncbi:hypothetical protein B0H34DRAFT_796708 [Crassisporium funariophilum]|nr:hypothetical protein B0H34DRAFT_796708 [Crassisporium funariophilum]